jgi:uncharacterized protein (DUF433 family)
LASETPTEAERMREVQGIVFVDGPGGRRARVAGTSIDVIDIIRTYHAIGEDRTQFYEAFDALSEDTISIAFLYYRAFPLEIDALLDQEKAHGSRRGS